MNETTIWQVAVRYRDGRRWKSYKTGWAHVSKRAALDRATHMQQSASLIAQVPERWFVVPTTLAKE